MAYANFDITRNGGSRLNAWIHEILGDLSQYAARKAAYRETLNELSKLTDRELHDIDISRGDIYRVAREAADLA